MIVANTLAVPEESPGRNACQSAPPVGPEAAHAGLALEQFWNRVLQWATRFCRAGWLQFGEPGPPTRPALPPEHFVKPAPGLLALFPSSLWHGTVPFGGDEARLSIAFDVVPI